MKLDRCLKYVSQSRTLIVTEFEYEMSFLKYGYSSKVTLNIEHDLHKCCTKLTNSFKRVLYSHANTNKCIMN